MQFCAECGSSDLSTPTPPASFLHHLSGIVLYLFSLLSILLILVSVAAVIFYNVDWSALAPSLVELVLMVGVSVLDDDAAAWTESEGWERRQAEQVMKSDQEEGSRDDG